MKILFIALFGEWKLFYEYYKEDLTLLLKDEKQWVYLFRKQWIIYQTGMGPIKKLSFLDYLWENYQINECLNIGFAGTTNKNLKIGEIVVPEKIMHFKGGGSYINEIDFNFKKINMLVTFDQVQENVMKSYQDQNIIIDMEAYYLFQILSMYNKKLKVIKIISDYANKSSIESLKTNYLNLVRIKIKKVMEIFTI